MNDTGWPGVDVHSIAEMQEALAERRKVTERITIDLVVNGRSWLRTDYYPLPDGTVSSITRCPKDLFGIAIDADLPLPSAIRVHLTEEQIHAYYAERNKKMLK